MERAPVPVHDHVHAVRIDAGREHQHNIVAHRLHLGALVGCDQVREPDGVLRSADLARVQAAVDPDDRLAFPRERTRLAIGHSAHERQTPGDVAIVLRRARLASDEMIATSISLRSVECPAT